MRKKIFDICNTVWDSVQSVLCSDAPEGAAEEDEVDGLDASSKDTLSYCWRALKDSRHVITNCQGSLIQ